MPRRRDHERQPPVRAATPGDPVGAARCPRVDVVPTLDATTLHARPDSGREASGLVHGDVAAARYALVGAPAQALDSIRAGVMRSAADGPTDCTTSPSGSSPTAWRQRRRDRPASARGPSTESPRPGGPSWLAGSTNRRPDAPPSSRRWSRCSSRTPAPSTSCARLSTGSWPSPPSGSPTSPTTWTWGWPHRRSRRDPAQRAGRAAAGGAGADRAAVGDLGTCAGRRLAVGRRPRQVGCPRDARGPDLPVQGRRRLMTG